MMVGQNSLLGTYNPNVPLKIRVLGDITGYNVEYDLNELKRFVGENTLIDCLIRNESSWQVNAVGDNSKSFGLLQFQIPTFNEFSAKYKLELNINNPKHQILLAKLMIADGYLYKWTTSRLCEK